MDKVILKGLEIFAYHGVNPEEKENGQKFVLDITVSADLSKPCQTDNVNDTVNYAALRKAATAAFCSEKFDLIERAAEVTCQAVLERFEQINEITLQVKKPEAPMNAVFEYAAVEITRSR